MESSYRSRSKLKDAGPRESILYLNVHDSKTGQILESSGGGGCSLDTGEHFLVHKR